MKKITVPILVFLSLLCIAQIGPPSLNVTPYVRGLFTNTTAAASRTYLGVTQTGAGSSNVIADSYGLGTNTTIRGGTNIGPTMIYGSENLTNALSINAAAVVISNGVTGTRFTSYGDIISTNSQAFATRTDYQNLNPGGRGGGIWRSDVGLALFDAWGSATTAAGIPILSGKGSAVDMQVNTTNGLSIRTIGTGSRIVISPNNAFSTIFTNGLVGINTQSPAQTLDVNGTALIETNLSVAENITNSSLTASKLVLSSAGKVLTSSAYGESDLATFVGKIDNQNGLGTNASLLDSTNRGKLTISSTTDASTGVVFVDASRFIHTYATNTADGFNTYAGVNAGNFTNGPAGGVSTLASYNSGFGNQALAKITTGYDLTASGFKALFSDTTGYGNSASGFQALRDNTVGYENSAHGTLALIANTSGHGNTANGASALNANTTGNNNTAGGSYALVSATTASDNSGFGNNTLRLNVTGTRNSAFGVNAAQATTVSDVTAGGYNALFANNNGASNSAWGVSVLQANTSGSNNTGSGASSQFSTTTGYNNTSAGADSLRYLTTGSGNVGVGYAAGYQDGNNTNANQRVSADVDLVLLGRGATRNSSTNLTNSIAIGRNAQVTANNQVVIGDSTIQSVVINGSHTSLTIGPGTAVTNKVSVIANLDFGTILAAGQEGINVTVQGAKTNDVVTIGLPPDFHTSVIVEGIVTSANTVEVRAHNIGAISSGDLTAKNFRIVVEQY